MPAEVYQEEPTLFEVFQPLVQRWKLLLLGVFAGTILATLVTFVLPKQYQASVLLQAGAVNDRQLEESYTIAEIINSDSFRQSLASKLNLAISPKMIQAATNMIRPSPMVTIDVFADTPQHAVQLADAAANAIIARHQPLFEKKLEYFINYDNELKNRIQSGNEDLDALNRDLATFQSNRNANLPSILSLQAKLIDRQTQVVFWLRDFRDAEISLAAVHSHNTSMVAPPVLPSRASKPNLKLNVVIGFFGSLFLMISFVLLVEQYRKASSRI
jgi:Uncharacterized protein involved in exopolysaccharide biosynthesis